MTGFAVVVILTGLFFMKPNSIGVYCFVLMGVVLLGACVLGYMDRKPRVVISGRGLNVRALKRGEIKWAEIESAGLMPMPRYGFLIRLRLVDGSRPYFDATWLEVPTDELLEIIQDRIAGV